jgi:hypothetical protein
VAIKRLPYGNSDFKRIVISDNIGIQNYIKEEYHIESPLIAYGGEQSDFSFCVKTYHKTNIF